MESRRERKKARTRQRLMSEGLRLFAEQGFQETTVEAIADAADVAPRTFFRYFPSKVDVLFGDHEELVALLHETVAERPADESVARAVRRANLAGVERVLESPEIYLARTRVAAEIPAASARSRHLDADYEQVIAEALALERGDDPAGALGAQVEARALWGASRAARQVWLVSDGAADPRALLGEAFDLVEAGFG